MEAVRLAGLDNENILVERAKTDDNAFSILYDFYFPRIYGFIFKRVGGKEVAEDIVSAVFMKAFTNLNSFYPQREASFSAWLYRIASNQLIDHYRYAGRRPTVALENINEPGDDRQNPQIDFLRQEERSLVERALMSLADKDREILTLKFYAELEPSEIADILKTNANNVGVMAYRALQKFKAIYQKYE
ncbi:sigma-70 family RNA polymerase sigma factor [Candidatus Falkowbacteria bacterium]|nr:sigma-70 family RNA polymerase sigma factor [Candidatus Falkowbacteria bacterium]